MLRAQLKPEQEITMSKEIKNWVLVSQQIPREFDILIDASGEHGIAEGPENKIIPGWDHRVYEVPEFGSFEGVQVNADDRFIAQVQGYSLEELDCFPLEAGMIGDMRAWAGDYRIFTPKGDYVNISPDGHDRYYRTFEPQRFGLEPFRSWDPKVVLGKDLSEEILDLYANA
jgi:hypothetical protein